MKYILKHIHYILVPIFYIAIAKAGASFTMQGISSWYPTITKPPYTPPGTVISILWTIIYILTAISFILFVNKGRGKKYFWHIIGLFLVNGIINAFWSYIFFVYHKIFLAFLNAVLIWISVALLMVALWRHSIIASLLLAPYLVWTSFATYLAFIIYRLN
ncbi:MAG TPA: tryptophan-rich sensory protein [Syntrophorhabdaceae bacterium]|nr:tryptophan-rich sensory protein [Syntrophorhabdaceae bacterium]